MFFLKISYILSYIIMFSKNNHPCPGNEGENFADKHGCKQFSTKFVAISWFIEVLYVHCTY